MKKNKYIAIVILMLIITMSLCACSPKATEICRIDFITDKHIPLPTIGDFRLASISNDNYSRIFEILPQDKEDFKKFMQQSEYYIGTYKLSADCYYLNEKNRCQVFKAGDECMWFAGKDYVWLGKFYANKFYYLTYMPMLGLRNSDINLEVSEAIFTNDEVPNEVGVEYKCPLTWEQLKLIYHERKIDEQNCSIELNCFVYYKEDQPENFYGSTLLYFNKDNNTVMVSSDYTKIELSEEEIWQLFG